MSQNLKKITTPRCPERGGKQGHCHFDSKLGYCKAHQTACKSSSIIHLRSKKCTCYTCDNTKTTPEHQANIDQATRAPPEPDPQLATQTNPLSQQKQPISQQQAWPPEFLKFLVPALPAASPQACPYEELDLAAEWKKLVHAADYLQDLYSLVLEVVTPLTRSFIYQLLLFINWIIYFVSRFWVPWVPGPLS